MILLYILLIVFILAVNFYAFLYMRSLVHAKKTPPKQTSLNSISSKDSPTTSEEVNDDSEKSESKSAQRKDKPKIDWKLFLSGALGGAITIYICMFIFKYKLNDLLLMIAMPVLAAANGYLWFVLFQSGFFIKV